VSTYERYSSGFYKAPVKLKPHEVGYGIETLEVIPKMTLICEYAADILPSMVVKNLFYKEHIMIYTHGKDSRSELILTPFMCSNWGPLINHRDVGNCSSLRAIINGKIRVLIYSLRRIEAG
jgi:hypothetical protein